MRDILKFLIYRIFHPVLLLLSIDKVLRFLGRNTRLIIMYHGVSIKKQNHINGRHLHATQFEKQLNYFKNNFNVVSLNDICKKSNKPDKHTIALTFDDGFLNNLNVAVPLLEKYQLPATFFTCSVNLGSSSYMHPADYLDLVSFAKKSRKEDFTLNNSLLSIINGTTSVKSLSSQDWGTALGGLSKYFSTDVIIKDVDEESYKLLNAQQAKELSLSRVASIGSHCYSHINITKLNAIEMNEQLVQSKGEIERFIGKPVHAIAFPYGRYNREAVELAKKAGYHYLIAAGNVEKEFQEEVFPRIGILGAGSYAQNILSINLGFKRFGF